jgi:beta-glucosidase
MNTTDPLDNTLTYNATGLADMIRRRGGSIWAGYLMPWEKLAYSIEIGQRYMMENTTLGIPALIESEGEYPYLSFHLRHVMKKLILFALLGLHGFTDNGTIWPSPIGLAASFNPPLLQKAVATFSDEAEGLGINTLFAPVLDLARELRWGRVEENYGEDPFL